ncbi:MAG: type I methionyl aminopeptidase [Candidatus Harrisonbacteria bacterium CG10_big_fil_rev_8_21_14_0_10_49_15]|uniref:Methionine aminopeptidase n=1 Tax=Candidatus Harrisonbacteria bacterium CG10_big_fil_rev_8_21_14_0_10_49_15 TaxID=1974587 RepID=A0A2H0UNH2_9BACT|nr:MAG: type I methionyl aminopeptidase [Candidatus Harrisonbacteria bacterium CG10_big_fil_rev_8_21_14_0_10_49_15]
MSLIKNESELAKIRHSGAIHREVMAKLKAGIKPGVTPKELDTLAKRLIEDAGAQPSFLGYQPTGATKPYPATICASLNEVVVHGVPTDKPLQAGDVFSIDMGVLYQGYHSDAAITVIVGGRADNKVHELLTVTKQALTLGIAAAQVGNTLGDIGSGIGSFCKEHGLAVIQGLTGHGIGTELHEDPYVFNEGQPDQGMKLEAGMVLAIEPMTSLGSPRITQNKDEGYATVDNSLSAHFEHTIILTESGPQVIT